MSDLEGAITAVTGPVGNDRSASCWIKKLAANLGVIRLQRVRARVSSSLQISPYMVGHYVRQHLTEEETDIIDRAYLNIRRNYLREKIRQATPDAEIVIKILEHEQ